MCGDMRADMCVLDDRIRLAVALATPPVRTAAALNLGSCCLVAAGCNLGSTTTTETLCLSNYATPAAEQCLGAALDMRWGHATGMPQTPERTATFLKVSTIVGPSKTKGPASDTRQTFGRKPGRVCTDIGARLAALDVLRARLERSIDRAAHVLV